MRRVLCVAGLVVLASCSSSRSRSTPQPTSSVPSTTTYGVITGVMDVIGGPYPGINKALLGTVTVRRQGASEVIARASTDAAGRFRISVTAGAYEVTGNPYEAGVGSALLTQLTTVTAGHTVTVDLFLGVS